MSKSLAFTPQPHTKSPLIHTNQKIHLWNFQKTRPTTWLPCEFLISKHICYMTESNATSSVAGKPLGSSNGGDEEELENEIILSELILAGQDHFQSNSLSDKKLCDVVIFFIFEIHSFIIVIYHQNVLENSCLESSYLESSCFEVHVLKVHVLKVYILKVHVLKVHILKVHVLKCMFRKFMSWKFMFWKFMFWKSRSWKFMEILEFKNFLFNEELSKKHKTSGCMARWGGGGCKKQNNAYTRVHIIHIKGCNWGTHIDWWLQPRAVFSHTFSGIIWYMPQK